MFYGYPIKVKENLFGCSAFFTSTKTEKYIVGRNFDYAKSGAVLVYTQPIKGYKSYSMVNLEHLGVSEKEGTMPNTLFGKLSFLSAPYGCVDGMNEKGLSVSVLELQTQPTNQNMGNPSITTTVAVRMLLDKASTTDEAVSLLKKYDMKSYAGKPYHFFIADARGKSIVVDWANQQLNIIETNIATNFQLSPGIDFQIGIGQDRYCILRKELEKNLLSLPTDAMDILKKVKIEWNGEWQTEWSIVYNLSDFSLDVVKSMEFNTVHHLPKNNSVYYIGMDEKMPK